MKYHKHSVIVILYIAIMAVISYSQEPKSAEEYYRRAETTMVTLPATTADVDSWRRAIDNDLEKAVALDPNNQVYIAEMAKYLVLHHSPKAKAVLDDLIRRKPTADLYTIRAGWFDEQEKRSLAILDRTVAIRLDPKNPWRYSDRAYEYSLVGQNPKALVDYNQAVSLGPQIAEMYFLRADLYSEMGRKAEAVADYTKAIELDPKEGYKKRADFYMNNGEDAKAANDWSKVIEQDPTGDFAYMMRAVVYEGTKEYEKAIADMTEAIKRLPSYSGYYSKRAELYRLVGKSELARQDADMAAKLSNQ